MGLNWGAGLTAFGKGLDGVRDAKEKTAELEYRNMRDQNLRRFQIEDREFKAGREDEKTAAANLETLRKEGREDEGLGIITDTDRGKLIAEKEKADTEGKQAHELEKIYARNKGIGMKPTQTREEYVQEKMKEMYEQYNEQQETDLTKPPTEASPESRMMPIETAKMWEARHGKDWDRFNAKYPEKDTPFEEVKPSQEEAIRKAQEVIAAGGDKAQVKAYLEAEGYDVSEL